jgi:hypothetical protein
MFVCVFVCVRACFQKYHPIVSSFLPLCLFVLDRFVLVLVFVLSVVCEKKGQQNFFLRDFQTEIENLQ